ncbi:MULTISPECIES: AAA family ATPase [Nostoc]|uniref:AAA family ATPase n=1 Tax=Nostoc paludosum FACHB-159 TaxID=2692908 RepID=A0ABR8KI69_9NOSO|nr:MULTISPECIES: AAA family ATPase [Nostoc]MBD2679341.1 AAA family ATPase [Nostoc sp. FACHB-857]MBD2738558.1 AAA family ATPase [Nostoc paludosum FACHB-159]
MIELEGYKVLTELHASPNSQVYRGYRELDRQPVVLKVLRQEYPPPEAIARFKLEYDLTRCFQAPGIIQAYDLKKYQNTFVLVLEDFGGQPLRGLLNQSPLPIQNFWSLAIQIATALEEIHQQQIIHKDINPGNILLNPKTQQTKIIDFGIATRLSRENPTLRNLNVLEGTLAYISPEQTGRMNRSLDYRTDFYSLGVTFYELLTQQLPFISDDPVELVHSHIAKQPIPPDQINPQIPPALSQIVMKLLEKTAEARYQSAFGLQADLKQCLEMFNSTGQILLFELGQQDRSGRFQIPQKLYGREAQVAHLLAAFERASYGQSEVMLIAGYSGIGKSALVQEIYKPITQQRGYFISGKFDQLQRNIPYSSLIQAFQALIRQLLTTSEAEITTWREKLLNALGVNGRVIIEVIAEVELIIGTQPPVVELSPKEAQARFNLVLQNFIKVFTQKEHPLVMFLDDLQWADSASLQLIELLISQADSQYLLLIGAYRDNEVDKTHPLRTTIASLEQAGVTIHELTLTPLALPQIQQLLSDTLNNADLAEVTPLAELLQQKTNGNPFFMNEFLKSLYTEGLLQFNFTQRTWQWQLAKIQAAQITDNVVELMALKIQKLPAATQEALKLAACIGNTFDLHILAIASSKSLADIAAQLWEALQTGLISPQGNDYQLLQVADGEVTALTNLDVVYKFLHDRVQQAAYSLIPTDEKQAVHLRVGQLLLQGITPSKQEEKIFDIVNQLNFGIDLITDAQQRQELAQLNLTAGNKAKASAAYQPALDYLTMGINCLATNCWQEQYELALALHTAAAEAAYLGGDFERMDALTEEVLQKTSSTIDRVQVYAIEIQAAIARDRLLAASQLGLQVMQLLGIPLAHNPGQPQIILGLLKTKLALGGKQVHTLADLPKLTNPTKLAAIRILASIASATYLAAPNVFPLTVFKQVELSAKYGNAAESAFAYATYGLILCGVVGDLPGGYKFGELALKVLDRFNAKHLQARTLFVVNSFVRHWQEPLQNTISSLHAAFQIGRDTGDTEYAAFCANTCSMHSYFSGQNLAELDECLAIYGEAVHQFKKQPIFTLTQLYRQVVANLQGKNANPCQLVGEFYDATVMLPQHIEGNYRTAIFYVYTNHLTLNYWFEDYATAVNNADLAIPYLDAVIALYIVGWFYFYDSLGRLALACFVNAAERQKLLQRVAANQKKLQVWAKFSPVNYTHKLALVEAEWHRVHGESSQAIACYDRAIALAQSNQYLNEAALANELTAKFYLAENKFKIAQVYLQEARYLYLQWGAIAKVKDLEAKYPEIFTRSPEKVIKSLTTTSYNQTSLTSTSRSESLDLVTVIKAYQALSEEIHLDKLLSNLMRILMENAGAQRGFLLLESKGKFLIEAQGSVGENRIQVLESLSIEDSQTLSTAIVNYVIRTKTNVVLNDAIHEAVDIGEFIKDPYIRQHQPRSILCTPLINQGKLTGIVYLENNLTTGAFTPDRLELLNLLSAQAAISIENARLYTDLAALNKAYERFVPRQFLQFLNKQSIIDVQLGDQVQREMSVLFTDIRSFTTLSESMTPAENFRFINAYLSRMEPIILQHNGFIDKYIGDAIMALFAGDADDAVLAGIAMLQTLTTYNEERQARGYLPIQIGIGINTGSLILGTVGGMNRMDSTVISDAVNLASRIEGLTKTFNAPLLITDQTFQRLQHRDRYGIRVVGQVKVKGKANAVTVHEVFAADPPKIGAGKTATLEIFASALACYEQQQFAVAAEYFQDCLQQNPWDRVAKMYLECCQLGQQTGSIFTEIVNF